MTERPLPPARFGKYELLARLARGGMAETFRAQLKGAAGVTKQVVIKKVLPHFAQDEAFVTAFINEAKLSAALSHGNIAQVFDFGRVEGDYFIAMEFVDGRSLAQVLERAATRGFARLPVPIACFLAMEVLKGLHYAHTRVGDDGQPLNLVHRDISPDNLLVSFEGQTKIVDFGVAKAVLRGRTETEPGLVKGKFLYFSPEQACAERVDARSDLFAVGIVLYRMLCGVLPFEGQQHVVMRAVAAGRFRPAPVVNPELPSALAPVLARAMATDRAARYPTALEFEEALASFLHRQEPTFSSETIKEWMKWLFSEELEAERRDTALSSRFLKRLESWHPRSESTAPSVRAITREASGVKRGSPPIALWVAGAVTLVAAGIGVGIVTAESEQLGPPPAVPMKNPFPEARIDRRPLAPPVAPPPASPPQLEPTPEVKPVEARLETAPPAKPSRPGELRAAAFLELAKRTFKEKQYPAARVQLQDCLKHDPRNADCYKLLGTVWAKLEQPERGARAYREFLRVAPKDHPDWDKVSQILEQFEKNR